MSTLNSPASPVATGSCEVDGHPVAYLEQGSGSSVVIVHGIGGRKEDFLPVMAALSAHFKVHAIDMLGFGQSARDLPAITIGLQVRAVQALLAQQGIARTHLIGNSLGAWVTAAFAAANPAVVDRLVLIDAAGLRVTLSGPPPVNFAPDTVDEMHTLLATVLDAPFAQTPEFAAQALADFKAGGEAATLAKLFAAFGAPDNTDRPLDDILPSITCPTLVAWGANDRLFPAALADVVAGGIQGARKILIPDASHFPQVDNPDALNEVLLDFLR
jgi:pimeloyl-ACP methyl ester carboxylesterase